MYRKYSIVQSIASSVSQYESYHDQVYCYTPTFASFKYLWDMQKRNLFQILNSCAHICSPTRSCHGLWNSRVIYFVRPLLAFIQPWTQRLSSWIFTRGLFWPPGIVIACVHLSVRHQVCPRDNSTPVQARHTKFGPKMQNTLVMVPIVLWGNPPWPSRSNLT